MKSLEKSDLVTVPFKAGRRQYGILLRPTKDKAAWRVRIAYKSDGGITTEHRDIPVHQIRKLIRVNQIPQELLKALYADFDAVKLHAGSYLNSLVYFAYFDRGFDLNEQRIGASDHKYHFTDSPLAAKRLFDVLQGLGCYVETRRPTTGVKSVRIQKDGKTFIAAARSEEMALSVASLKMAGLVPENAICA